MKTKSTTKVKIRKEIFLGEFKVEDYLQKQVELLLEKYKKDGFKED
ncbi:hypothetical protein [Neobacillus sp. SuZ13]|nr:hypothetical protein [Neobacillus sp. SuZ13]WHY64664.1 hypothetical protein QNH17_16180 [Neobacillus sp. SuZ13]